MTGSLARQRWLLALGGAALTLVLTVVTLTSTTRILAPLPAVTVAAGSFALVWAVATHLWGVAGRRRLAGLLFMLGGIRFLTALGQSDSSLLYTIARLVGPFSEVMLIAVVLAYPSGRLERRRDRGIVLYGAVVCTLVWAALVALSPTPPFAAPVGSCGPCPTNLLNVADNPTAAGLLTRLFQLLVFGLYLAAALAVLDRLHRATPIARVTLAPLLLAMTVRCLAMMAFLLTGGTFVGAILAVTYMLVPIAIEVGLLRGEVYLARALYGLVRGLRDDPDERRLREIMAAAISDPTLTIRYWLPQQRRWVDERGASVELSVVSPAAVTEVSDADGTPVAALLHDPAVSEQRRLVDAVGAAAFVALRTQRLQSALAASRRENDEIASTVRQSVQRDLHDGAQQRLIALRLKLRTIGELAQPGGAGAELVGQLTEDVDATLAQLREIARGGAPADLVRRGLAALGDEASAWAAVPVSVRFQGLRRYPPEVEGAVYFCVVEALQNVARHAGDGATATVEVVDDGLGLSFAVTDDGPSVADPDAGGRGLRNIRERIEGLGGEVTVGPGGGGGFEVVGRVPLQGPGSAATTPADGVVRADRPIAG